MAKQKLTDRYDSFARYSPTRNSSGVSWESVEEYRRHKRAWLGRRRDTARSTLAWMIYLGVQEPILEAYRRHTGLMSGEIKRLREEVGRERIATIRGLLDQIAAKHERERPAREKRLPAKRKNKPIKKARRKKAQKDNKKREAAKRKQKTNLKKRTQRKIRRTKLH